MSHKSPSFTANSHWAHDGLAQEIVRDLETSGKNLASITIADLAPYDQFHGGGQAMTLLLAHAAQPKTGSMVLDVGGGLGGPARMLVAEFGCDVTVLDITTSYLEAGRALTKLIGIESQVKFVEGSALELPFDSSSFDLVWTQNSGMNIENKKRLYQEFRRVLRPDGKLAFQEPMAGPVTPVIYPVMWARDASTSFLHSPNEMRTIIEVAGFDVTHWHDFTEELAQLRARSANSQRGIQAIVMGELLPEISAASTRNTLEQRVVMIQAVCRARG